MWKMKYTRAFKDMQYSILLTLFIKAELKKSKRGIQTDRD